MIAWDYVETKQPPGITTHIHSSTVMSVHCFQLLKTTGKAPRINSVQMSVWGVRRQLVRRNLGSHVMMKLHHIKPLLCLNYLFYAAGCERTKAVVYWGGKNLGCLDESPFTLLWTSGWLYVCHTWKEIYSPKCLFPTVKASVRTVLVSGPGMVYIHSVPQQAGKCQKLHRLSGWTHF